MESAAADELQPIMEPNGYCHPCKRRIRGGKRRRMRHGLRHLAEVLKADLERQEGL